ncbi:GNAT family N-acetyltransferase [Caulobacter sp. D4A]|uniref:GNAT family N-acetyltransferase n=1 Tax=unclassified Caulobacter TaxID=2648921 RepID=UPI000D73B7F5|nr:MULTISPECIES: GNAT family N-acetyltransferase [unclassified Caulobacter]PXA91863.1 GNAT family N-acetyltransferase [Caulobacter sp. D5]PXA94681.1 GNAT family N-acetyltransferase [Caulobacter sp. D4A]
MSPDLLEPIADGAWPARERERLGGWRLNATDGFSLRINACWPLGEPDRDPEAAIDAVEAFYAERGLPVRFKLTEGMTAPADLAERLARRGYATHGETLVMTGAVAGLADPDVTLSTAPDPAFEAVLVASAKGDLADARERLEALARIPAPARFARLAVEGRAAALGACAVDGEAVGIFGMRTDPDFRRRGLARRVLDALLAEADGLGARTAYLQAEAANAPAIALYAARGFSTAYRYRYWSRPARD